MHVLKKNSDIIKYKRLRSYMDDKNYERKYNYDYDYLKNEEIQSYNKYTMISNNVRICNFLAANVTGEEYSHKNFIVQSTLGYFICTIRLMF